MTRAVYAEIVVALVDARPDPATERFDAEVGSCRRRGAPDPNLDSMAAGICMAGPPITRSIS